MSYSSAIAEFHRVVSTHGQLTRNYPTMRKDGGVLLAGLYDDEAR